MIKSLTRIIYSTKKTRCEGCLSMASPLKVTCGCKYAQYCSESCKESDWDDHRDECFYIGRSKKNPSCDTARFVLRSVLFWICQLIVGSSVLLK